MLLAFSVVVGCTNNGEDAPDGMQTVKGGEEYGFYMYAPAEWTVANHGDIAAVYTSKIDNSSVTFAEGEMPENIIEYFAEEMANLPFEITPVGDEADFGKACTFGNATEAYKFIFSYTYDEIPFRCMQILVKHDGRFFIFTFTSYETERREGETYYDYYLESVQKVIDSFKFVEKKAGDETTVEYERDEDGYILISDKKLAGFDMYVPESWRVIDSSAIVSALGENGASVNISKPTYTDVNYVQYWEHRMESLNRIIDKTVDTDGKEVSSLKLLNEGRLERDGVDNAYFYEYEYTLFGKTYRVYQALLAVDSFSGYVFTYSAEAAVFEESLEEAMRVLDKARF